MEPNQWNLKQSVANKIIAQLETATAQERRALIVKLLEQVRPEFLIALDFAYEMAPAPTSAAKARELHEADRARREVDEQERALDYQMQESQDETGTHAPNCRCPWCSSEEV